MVQTIQTNRLILRLLQKDETDRVLEFLQKNRVDFEKYEAAKQEIYYSKVYQEYIVQNEYEAALKKSYLRYYLFEKDNPQGEIVGTVSISHIKAFPYCSGYLGYKMAIAHKNKGYVTEAIQAVCEEPAEYLGLHRLEAFVMQDNLPSIRVLEKCGFELEGLCRKNLQINGEWKDHFLFGKVIE